jgi:hypothetical protein
MLALAIARLRVRRAIVRIRAPQLELELCCRMHFALMLGRKRNSRFSQPLGSALGHLRMAPTATRVHRFQGAPELSDQRNVGLIYDGECHGREIQPRAGG